MSLALDVARAALMEVGEDPATIWEKADPVVLGRISLLSNPATGHTDRASCLGVMAEYGPQYLVRCDVCGLGGIRCNTVPCTPVRDALAGRTCGAAS